VSADTANTTCAMCTNESVGRFDYRALNGTYSVEEPLCGVCATLLARVGSVVSIEPASEVGIDADTLSLVTPFGSSMHDAGRDEVG
jgi:hypothetical protein